jgi:hypothetical protein
MLIRLAWLHSLLSQFPSFTSEPSGVIIQSVYIFLSDLTWRSPVPRAYFACINLRREERKAFSEMSWALRSMKSARR